MSTISAIIAKNNSIKNQNQNAAAIKDDTDIVAQMQAITNEINRLRQINSADPRIAELAAKRTQIGTSDALWY